MSKQIENEEYRLTFKGLLSIYLPEKTMSEVDFVPMVKVEDEP